jgi:hypothetical protein
MGPGNGERGCQLKFDCMPKNVTFRSYFSGAPKDLPGKDVSSRRQGSICRLWKVSCIGHLKKAKKNGQMAKAFYF